MGVKQIPPAEARRVAGICRQVESDLGQMMTELETRINGLEGAWRGQAERAYMQAFLKRVSEQEGRLMLLLRMAEALDKIARAGELAEDRGKKIAQQVGQ
jgi:WXG100 family type VII secretion target